MIQETLSTKPAISKKEMDEKFFELFGIERDSD